MKSDILTNLEIEWDSTIDGKYKINVASFHAHTIQ